MNDPDPFGDVNITYQNSTDHPMVTNELPQNSIGAIIVGFLRTYVNPFIATVGISGNCVSIMVFSAKSLRRLSSTVYVQAVLVSDTCFLLTLLALWLESFGYNAVHMNGICQGNIYLSYVGSFLSVWYVVCITIENYITICHPLQIMTLCTFTRARISTVTIACAGLIMFSVIIPITTPLRLEDPSNNSSYQMMCSTSEEYTKLMYILTYIDTVITILLPMIIILILLSLITIATIRSVHKKRLRMANKENQTKKLSDVPQVRVAKLLFAISATFILLNLPSHGVRLVYLFVPYLFLPTSITMFSVQQCLLYISYSSFSLKFFIFYIFSGNFRKILLEKIFCCFSGLNHEHRANNRV